MKNNKSLWEYKNFNMVVELDIAGEFIYNGIHEFNRMRLITNDGPTFSALYNIAVGIERLQKIVLVLWKLDDTCDAKEFEKSLITHSHSLLRDEIKKYAKGEKKIIFNERENDFISLIQEFYNSARYKRFNIEGKNDDEITIVEKYLYKYMKNDIRDDSTPFIGNGIVMTEEISELFGKVVGSISHKYYELVNIGSHKNSTYTYELRSDSKAQKIFLSDYKKHSLMVGQFNEKIAFKEVVIYLKNSSDKNPFLKFLEEIEPLHFEPEFINEYLGELSKGIISQQLIDEVEYLYGEEEYSIDRIRIVDLIGSTGVWFDYPLIEECGKILSEIIDKNKIDDTVMERFVECASYINDNDVESVLDDVKKYYHQLKSGMIEFSDFLEQVIIKSKEYQQFLIKENGEDVSEEVTNEISNSSQLPE